VAGWADRCQVVQFIVLFVGNVVNVHPLHRSVVATRTREVITCQNLPPKFFGHRSLALRSLPLVDVVDAGPELDGGVAHMCAFDA
jgi:hypothetical protein